MMDAPTLLGLAQNAVDVGNVEAACAFCQTAHQLYPNNEEVLEAYAEILIHYAADVPRAKQMLQYAITMDPDRGYVKYLNMAQLCESHEALQWYKKAMEIIHREITTTRKKKAKQGLMETMATTWCAIAELYLTDLCFEEDAEQHCEEAVSQALACNSEAVEPHQLRGSLLLSQGRHDEASVSLRTAVEITHRLSEEHQPTYESKIELGRLVMQVNPHEAFSYLLEVLQLDDTNPYVWFLLGQSAILRGRYPDAARLLRRSRVLVVAANGDPQSLKEIDEAILALVEKMGGPEAAQEIENLDCVNPIELLEPEEDEDGEADEGDAELNEPEWESTHVDD